MIASSADGVSGGPTWGNGSAPERVAGILRDELFDGVMPPGTRLREEELSDRFGLGRHTIRTALRLLVDRKLIIHERNRGAFVPELTQERIDDLFGFRKILEGVASAWRWPMARTFPPSRLRWKRSRRCQRTPPGTS